MKTDWFKTNYGVKQGDNLSPTLFSIYLNDLATELKDMKLGTMLGDMHICILLYADDIVLISENEQNLQNMLDHVNAWCLKWQMKINPDKTKVVHFRNPRTPRTNFNFKIGQSPIQISNTHRYLGIILDEFLNFNACVKTLGDAGGRALSSIISKFKQFKHIGYNTFSKLYESGVLSILTYGASIWGHDNDKYIQQVQNRAIRYFLGVHKTAPIQALQADMGWLNIKYQFYLCTIRFWNRLHQMNSNRLTKKVAEYQLINISDYNWIGKLYNILEKTNKTDFLLEDQKLNLYDVENQFYDIMQEEWSVNICFKPKLWNYVKFKQDIFVEPYVTSNINRYQRSLLAKLRMGILPLQIETGRYFRKPLEDRLCLLCDQNNIEDEYHFLCQCPAFRSEREKILHTIPNFQSLAPNELFIQLMKSDVKILSAFVEKCWHLRKSIESIG